MKTVFVFIYYILIYTVIVTDQRKRNTCENLGFVNLGFVNLGFVNLGFVNLGFGRGVRRQYISDL